MALLLLLGVVPAAAAATIVDADDYTLAAGETVEGNLYAFGNTVTIDGTVTGDLIATGSAIKIGPEGRVGGDLMAGGGEISVSGTVDGDVRSAGYLVEIADGGSVGGEVLAAGFSLEVDEGARVDGEARFGGYQVILGGDIGDDVWVGSGALEVAGAIDGDLTAYVDVSGEGSAPMVGFPGQPSLQRTLQPGIDIKDSATIAGNLTYEQPADVDLDLDVGGVAGEVKAEIQAAVDEATSEVKEERPPVVAYLLDVLKRYIGLALLGLLALWWAPRLTGGATERIAIETGESTLWGFGGHAVAAFGLFLLLPLTILLMVLAGLLSLGSVLNWPILSASALTGSALLFGFGLLRWLGRIVFALWLGGWLLRRAAPNVSLRAWAALLVGAVLYAFLAELPLIGFWLDLLATIVAVGALLRELRRRFAASRGPDYGDLDDPLAQAVTG
jgi:cytoskeletal protein CcmA (bactofilin family)